MRWKCILHIGPEVAVERIRAGPSLTVRVEAQSAQEHLGWVADFFSGLQ